MEKNDWIAGGIFIALGIGIFILTIPFPSLDKGHPGPALFPNILAALFIFFGLLLGLKAKKPSVDKPLENSTAAASIPKNIGNAFFILGIIAAFMVLESWLGFLLTSFFLLFLLMKKLGTSAWKSLTLSVLVTVFVYFLFYKILRVPLSPGFLSW